MEAHKDLAGGRQELDIGILLSNFKRQASLSRFCDL